MRNLPQQSSSLRCPDSSRKRLPNRSCAALHASILKKVRGGDGTCLRRTCGEDPKVIGLAAPLKQAPSPNLVVSSGSANGSRRVQPRQELRTHQAPCRPAGLTQLTKEPSGVSCCPRHEHSIVTDTDIFYLIFSSHSQMGPRQGTSAGCGRKDTKWECDIFPSTRRSVCRWHHSDMGFTCVWTCRLRLIIALFALHDFDYWLDKQLALADLLRRALSARVIL